MPKPFVFQAVYLLDGRIYGLSSRKLWYVALPRSMPSGSPQQWHLVFTGIRQQTGRLEMIRDNWAQLDPMEALAVATTRLKVRIDVPPEEGKS